MPPATESGPSPIIRICFPASVFGAIRNAEHLMERETTAGLREECPPMPERGSHAMQVIKSIAFKLTMFPMMSPLMVAFWLFAGTITGKGRWWHPPADRSSRRFNGYDRLRIRFQCKLTVFQNRPFNVFWV